MRTHKKEKSLRTISYILRMHYNFHEPEDRLLVYRNLRFVEKMMLSMHLEFFFSLLIVFFNLLSRTVKRR